MYFKLVRWFQNVITVGTNEILILCLQAHSMQIVTGPAMEWVWSFSGLSRVGVANTAVSTTEQTKHYVS